MSIVNKLRFALLFVCLMGMGKLSHAQTFCHHESNTPFTFLSSPIVLTGDSAWDDNSYIVPIGFNFLFQGIYYDTLTVETNGRIYFSDTLGNDEDPTITPFGGPYKLVDMIDRGTPLDTSLSPISYKLFENPTDTFLVIEYKNVGFYKNQPALDDSISFQLTLHRTNGKVEVHIGPHKITDTSCFYTTGPTIGLGNHFGDNGYFLTGDPGNPGIDKYISTLDTVPDEGSVYTFTPVLPNPAITISSLPIDGCFDPATNYTFTAVVINEPLPFLQWKKNGISLIGENTILYNAGLLSKDDSITCELRLTGACPTALPITSNRIIVSKPVAAITIAASAASICTGDSILFAATVANEGDHPSYKWIVNADTTVSLSAQFIAKNLNDQDTVRCILLSDMRCVATTEVASDSIVITVLPIQTPQVSILASKDSICTGDSVLYTATALYGGTAPNYQWKVNGAPIGTNAPSLYITHLNDLDTVSCEMTSSLPCVSGLANSNKHVIKVRTYTIATVSISADLTDLCAGQPVTFTATPTNEGTMPVYVWKNNGVTAGSNSTTFAASSFSDHDSIACIMSSSLFCSNTDTSNSIRLAVHSLITPSISISVDRDSICAGDNLSFTAHSTDGGTTPSYQWILNGSNTGLNNPQFSATSFNNNDQVNCVLSSNLRCLSASSVSSDTLYAKVVSYANAGITISSDASTVCNSTTVHFTATPSNGGPVPSYQWKTNGSPVGTDDVGFSASGFNNNDQVTCTLVSDLFCVNNPSVTSLAFVMNVISEPTSTISITANQNPICEGGNISFHATTVGISTPVYKWELNNALVGINSANFTASGFVDGDEVLCKISNSVDCSGGLPTSNIVQVQVNGSIDPEITIQPDKNILCEQDTVTYTAILVNAGTNPTYEWAKNNILVSTDASYSLTNPSNDDLIVCKVTSSAGCQAISNTLSVTVTICLGVKENIGTNQIEVYPNPFEENISITLHPSSSTQLTLLDATGNTLRNETVAANNGYNAEWILPDLKSGLYLLKIEQGDEVVMQKIIKQ